MKQILCPECGHPINEHDHNGCWHEQFTQLMCLDCNQTPESIAAHAIEAAGNSSFFGGLSTALAVISTHGEDTIYDEVVETLGDESLQMFIQHLKDNDEMEFSGMDKYIERHPAPEDVDGSGKIRLPKASKYIVSQDWLDRHTNNGADDLRDLTDNVEVK